MHSSGSRNNVTNFDKLYYKSTIVVWSLLTSLAIKQISNRRIFFNYRLIKRRRRLSFEQRDDVIKNNTVIYFGTIFRLLTACLKIRFVNRLTFCEAQSFRIYHKWLCGILQSARDHNYIAVPTQSNRSGNILKRKFHYPCEIHSFNTTYYNAKISI